MSDRPPLALIKPSTSPEEAAAIVASIEQFMRERAAPADSPDEHPDPWLRAAMLDGVARGDRDEAREPWINT